MNKKLCRLLTDKDRHDLAPLIEQMFRDAHDMMARKFPRANVQQAWMLHQLSTLKPKLTLCAGAYEDTAFECWRKYAPVGAIFGIDPHTDLTLNQFRKERKQSSPLFDCVFSTSVLEHVPDDEGFIRDVVTLLKEGGTGLLTVDFLADWKRGDKVPGGDGRFYTPSDVNRIGKLLNELGCKWVDEPDFNGAPDFEHDGCKYSFMALAFTRG